MADTLSAKHRSWNMSRIRNKGTRPEQKLYLLCKTARYKIRRNVKGLPGTPDILLVRTKTAVFLHGCFWHRHRNCKYSYKPKSNVNFWKKKFAANIKRDKTVKAKLLALGYRVAVVWECQLKDERFSLRNYIKRSVSSGANK